MTDARTSKKELTNGELTTFFSAVSLMLSSGISPAEACEIFAQDNTGVSAQISAAMSELMQLGEGFAQAAKNAGCFPAYALGVLRAAEYAGRLEEALEGLAGFYDRQETMRQQLKNSLTYPAVLTVLMCVVLAVLVFGVLPVFGGVYENLTGSIAASSFGYVLAAGWIARISLVGASLLALVLLGVSAAAAFPKGREKLLTVAEAFPLTRSLMRKLAVSRLADTLSVLMCSGVDTDTALSFAADMTTHKALRKNLAACARQMEEGAGLASSLYENGIFTALYGRMLVSGFAAGRPEDALRSLSLRLNRDAQQEIDGLTDWVEPVLMGFLAVAVGLTLLSIMLPLLGVLGAV